MSRFETFPTVPASKRRGAWDLADAAVLLGLGLVVAGVAMMYPPAGLIVGGLALVGVVMLSTLTRGDHP